MLRLTDRRVFVYERTRKETHLDTMWYEIDMLEHCVGVLLNDAPRTSDPYWNLLIEGFLLHYRNLIQFFGGNEQRHRRHRNDLSTFAPAVWAERLVEAKELDALRTPGVKLDNEFSNKISVCLQHCTRERAETLTDWNIPDMYERLAPLIATFKRAFPRRPGFKKVALSDLQSPSSSSPAAISYSTATVAKGASLFPDPSNKR
jgi:hypothetical protein